MTIKKPPSLTDPVDPRVKERFDRAIASLSNDSDGVIASTQNFFQTLMPVSERLVYDMRMKENPPEQVPSRFEMTARMRSHKPKWDELVANSPSMPIPIVPVAGDVRLTSAFGARENPFEGREHSHRHAPKEVMHRGIDLAPAERGKRVPVISAMPGIVIEVTPERYSGGFGNMVRVVGIDGRIYEYGHLKNFSVKEGDTVQQGSRIGIMGNSGRSTATHLHYGVIASSNNSYVYVNPDIDGKLHDRSAEGMRILAAQEMMKPKKDAIQLADSGSAGGHGLTQRRGDRDGPTPSRG